MATEYNHKDVEKKWQDAWRSEALYKAVEDSTKPKAYVLDMFPYPSGEGLHIGHPKGYTATDVFARMKRMQGYSVLHPMGWDAFGLPAENYAIKNKVHPRAAVEKNIARFKSQLEAIGFDYDWGREINTTDPEYYKWTQWIFLKLYERGLAYESHEPINWCPSCQTGLSNEDLDDGKCERCGSDVEQRPMRQWVLKITEYADRLLEDLETLPKWQEHIRELQRNWIGRSEGAEIDFSLANRSEKVTVFTTRPDTLYGATYMVLAPEHPLVDILLPSLTNASDVRSYVDATRKKTELERQENKHKTGCELKGVRAINPATNEDIPLFIADYVLAHYGTGAIMAVPAHDERDHAFAQQFSLPIRAVVEPVLTQTSEPGAFKEDQPFEDNQAIIGLIKHWSEEKYLALKWKEVAWGTFLTGGIDEGMNAHDTVIKELKEETGYVDIASVEELGMVHSRFFHVPKQKNRFGHAHVMLVTLKSGEQIAVDAQEAAKHDLLWLTPEELGTFLTAASHQYLQKKLVGNPLYTEWGILTQSGTFSGMDSREAKKKIVESVGGRLSKTYRLKDWVFSRQRYWGEPIPVIHCPLCGVVPVPESQLPVTLPDVEQYAPTGTGESPLAAIETWVNVPCPTCGEAAKRETNTMPQWAGSSWYYLRYMDPHNANALVDSTKERHWAGKSGVDMYVGGAEHATRHLIYARFWHKVLFDMGVVSTPEPFEQLISVGLILAEDGRKMSKRFGNVINPEDIIETWGADTMRLYTMFMGPFTDAIAWNTENMIGARRFLERLFRLGGKVTSTTPTATEIELHKTIKKVTSDIQDFKFNTAIAQMMILLNTAEKEGIALAEYRTLVQLVAPFAPHIAEELWHEYGGAGSSVHTSSWPTHDESKLISDTLTIAVQVLGKLRTTITIARTSTEEEVKGAAREAVRKWTEGKSIAKEIYVPGKIVNFIVA
jgi:leucyl-tRNA synthetase